METQTKLQDSFKKNLITFSDCFEDYFVNLVDIVESTKVTASLSIRQACRYYTIFLNEMAKVADRFGGKVVKNIGDSLLFYFPKESIDPESLVSSRSIECGLEMLARRKTLNELLASEHLPSIRFRVSADYGKVMIARQVNSSCDDIFGPPVNMCAKINHHARPNSMVVGGDMYEISKSHQNFKFIPCTGCSAGLKFNYPVYLVERIPDFEFHNI